VNPAGGPPPSWITLSPTQQQQQPWQYQPPQFQPPQFQPPQFQPPQFQPPQFQPPQFQPPSQYQPPPRYQPPQSENGRRTTTITLGGPRPFPLPTNNPGQPWITPRPESSSSTTSGWFGWLSCGWSGCQNSASQTYNSLLPQATDPAPAPAPTLPPPGPAPAPSSSGIPPWLQPSSSDAPPPWIQPASSNAPPPWVSPSSSSTLPPWSRQSDNPWSVPPPPPPGWTPGLPLTQASSSTSRPAPWHPPNGNGGSWTPVVEPTLPNNSPPAFTPIITTASPTSDFSSITTTSPKSTTGTSTSSTSKATSTSIANAPTGPAVTVPGQGPVKCGPGLAKCTGNTYCDPQPLCSIGEDCPGVCLPVFNEKRTVNVSLFSGQKRMFFTNFPQGTEGAQPWEVRRQVWQDLLDQGQFVMYRYVT
jgi:hypothetical protein